MHSHPGAKDTGVHLIAQPVVTWPSAVNALLRPDSVLDPKHVAHSSTAVQTAGKASAKGRARQRFEHQAKEQCLPARRPAVLSLQPTPSCTSAVKGALPAVTVGTTRLAPDFSTIVPQVHSLIISNRVCISTHASVGHTLSSAQPHASCCTPQKKCYSAMQPSRDICQPAITTACVQPISDTNAPNAPQHASLTQHAQHSEPEPMAISPLPGHLARAKGSNDGCSAFLSFSCEHDVLIDNQSVFLQAPASLIARKERCLPASRNRVASPAEPALLGTSKLMLASASGIPERFRPQCGQGLPPPSLPRSVLKEPMNPPSNQCQQHQEPDHTIDGHGMRAGTNGSLQQGPLGQEPALQQCGAMTVAALFRNAAGQGLFANPSLGAEPAGRAHGPWIQRAQMDHTYQPQQMQNRQQQVEREREQQQHSPYLQGQHADVDVVGSGDDMDCLPITQADMHADALGEDELDSDVELECLSKQRPGHAAIDFVHAPGQGSHIWPLQTSLVTGTSAAQHCPASTSHEASGHHMLIHSATHVGPDHGYAANGGSKSANAPAQCVGANQGYGHHHANRSGMPCAVAVASLFGRPNLPSMQGGSMDMQDASCIHVYHQPHFILTPQTPLVSNDAQPSTAAAAATASSGCGAALPLQHWQQAGTPGNHAEEQQQGTVTDGNLHGKGWMSIGAYEDELGLPEEEEALPEGSLPPAWRTSRASRYCDLDKEDAQSEEEGSGEEVEEEGAPAVQWQPGGVHSGPPVWDAPVDADFSSPIREAAARGVGTAVATPQCSIGQSHQVDDSSAVATPKHAPSARFMRANEPSGPAAGIALPAAAARVVGSAVRQGGSGGGDGALLGVSSEAVQLGPECAMAFWEQGAEVSESFPLQRHALEFAAWCNAMPSSTVRGLQQLLKSTDFCSFTQRWETMQAWMASHPPMRLCSMAGPSGAATTSSAPTAGWAPSVQVQGQQQQQQQGQQQQWRPPHQQHHTPAHALFRPPSASITHEVQAAPPANTAAAGALLLPHQAVYADPAVAPAHADGATAAAPAAALIPLGGIAGNALPHGGIVPSSMADMSMLSALPDGMWGAVRVFTEEYKGRDGTYTRRFLACSYQGVWRRYQRVEPSKRHLYEVIAAGSPCHMYFDIEYSRAANPAADGDVLVDRLVAAMQQAYWELWQVHVTHAHVVEMESMPLTLSGTLATPRKAQAEPFEAQARAMHASEQQQLPDKFSRHLLIRVPGVALASNMVAGQLVHYLKPRMEAAGLYLAKPHEPGSSACIVDGAVYTKNRHFRMLWSCKGGKRIMLQHTPRYMSAAIAAQALHTAIPAAASALTAGGVAGDYVQSHAPAAADAWARSGISNGAVTGSSAAATLGISGFATPRKGGAGLQPTHRAGAGAAAKATATVTPVALFLTSLICNVHPSARLLSMPLALLEQLRSVNATGFGAVSRGQLWPGNTNTSTSTTMQEQTVYNPHTRGSIKVSWAYLAEGPSASGNSAQTPAVDALAAAAAGGLSGLGPAASSVHSAGNSSPNACMPASAAEENARRRRLLDVSLSAAPFLEHVAAVRAGGQPAQVRSIAYCGEGCAIAAGMIGPGSHYCERIQRAHGSNHVFFVVDFANGVFCQKCYDPECSGWRSGWLPLPTELCGHFETARPLPTPQSNMTRAPATCSKEPGRR